VWIAAGARGRYFMPLYPVAAVLIGILIEHCATASRGAYPRRAWRQFLALWATVIAVSGTLIGAAALLPANRFELHQPRWFSLLFACVAAGAACVLWRGYVRSAKRGARSEGIDLDPRSILAPVLTIAGFAGLAFTGLVINVNAARWNDPSAEIALIKAELPTDAKLVSLTPIEHRFAYYYREPIAELAWPRTLSDLPGEFDYFCYMRNPGDTAERRAAGRGRSWTTTPGTLPFDWEEIAAICVERRVRDGGQPIVVVGRVVRPLRPVVSDATIPRLDGERGRRKKGEIRLGKRLVPPTLPLSHSPTLQN
jgi:hypothetical protein